MAAVLLGATMLLLADSRVRIVRISFLAHGVMVRKPASDGVLGHWSTALLNSPVIEDEQFRTEANGEAEIELECGSALRLAPDSDLTVTRLRLRDNGVRRTTVTLTAGEAYFSVRRADATDFHVHVADGVVATPQGSATLRLQLPRDGRPTVELLSGHATIALTGRGYALQKNVRWALEAGGGLRRVADTKPDAFQRWSHHRDELFERELMASRPSTGVDAADSAPRVGSGGVSDSTMLLDPVGGFATLDARNPDPLLASAREVRKVPYCAGN
jgi:FecR protein